MKKVLFSLSFIIISTSYANAKLYVLGHKHPYNDNEYVDIDSRNYLNAACKKHCGRGYFYDRRGKLKNGEERICTKYPLKCGYKCTYSWDIRYLVNGTDFTCQQAIQDRKMQ